MPYPKGTHSNKLSHRLHSEAPMEHKEMDSHYAALHNNHDRKAVKPNEMDAMDNHFRGTPANPKAPNPSADLSKRDDENYPGQQEQE